MSNQRRALELIRRVKPRLVIGSPECIPISALQALNRGKFLDPEAKMAEREKATMHLEFCISLYREQIARGDWFLHEHPACVRHLGASPRSKV